MLISDWSSFVCSSDLSRSLRRSTPDRSLHAREGALRDLLRGRQSTQLAAYSAAGPAAAARTQNIGRYTGNMTLDRAAIEAVVSGDHRDPFSILGMHRNARG